MPDPAAPVPVAATDVVERLQRQLTVPLSIMGGESYVLDTDDVREAAAEITRLRAEVEELRAKLDRARPLVALLTVRQVIQGGDDAIAASGLNPWCINEGRATGDEPIGTWWLG